MADAYSAFFSDAEWRALPPAIRAGFIDLAFNTAAPCRRLVLGRVLVWLLPAWVGLQPRLYVGPHGNPQIAWTDVTGAAAELEIRDDRLVWYVEGQGQGSEVLLPPYHCFTAQNTHC